MSRKPIRERKIVNTIKLRDTEDIAQVRMNRLVADLLREHNLIRQSVFGLKGSEVRYLRLGAQYRAEIRASQSGIKAPQLNNNQAGFRRLSA